jgi:tetratricopeptide (TPR) repeat protein
MKKLGTSLLLAFALVAGGWSLQQAPAPSVQPKPAGKRPPQAKSQAEYKDYNTAYAINGGAAMEKAANDFAAKYPQSELRPYLYSKAMHEYQNENQPDKMLAMGEKVLALDPDNTIALVLTATVLSDSLSDSDTDRQQKVAEIKKNANRALETVDSGFVPPVNATPEQVTAYKSTLLSMAHSAMGITDLKTGDDSGAEKELQTAADLNKTQPDPYIWYHLALSQDHQNKYAAALESVNQALRYASSNPDLGKLAQGERDRLMKLTGTQPGQPNNSQPPQ